MKAEKMWAELAKYYDMLYEWKSYDKESASVHALIQKYKKTAGNELLDVACGTGNHIQFLKDKYKTTGIDLNKDMLLVAKKKFSKLNFYQKDMISFDLKKKFDVLVCLFSSIGYVKTYANLKKTIASFSKHVKSGGVVIIEPFFTKETFHSGKPHAVFVDKPDVKIARMHLSQRKGNIAILDFHFLIATKKGIGTLRDRHELGLFDVDKFLEILKSAGFTNVRFLKNGLMPRRGLFVAVKR
ncbi:MAG: class I SAM-dependent methyltransferase [Candidatus Woesearchaeota archaeon]